MQQVSTVLAGYQLALLPDIQAFWLENPQFADAEVVQVIRETVLPLQHSGERKKNNPEPKPKRVQVGWIEERISNRGLRSNGTGSYAKAETLAQQLFQKEVFSLNETYQLASKLFGTEIMNEIAGLSGS